MEFVFEKINVPNKHSFITRKLPLKTNDSVHSHKNFELNFIASGSGRRIVGDHISGFEQGDLVLLGPDVPHCWEILEEDKKLFVLSLIFQKILCLPIFLKCQNLKK